MRRQCDKREEMGKGRKNKGRERRPEEVKDLQQQKKKKKKNHKYYEKKIERSKERREISTTTKTVVNAVNCLPKKATERKERKIIE